MRTPNILSFRIVGGGTPAGAHAKKAFAAAKAKLPEAGAYYVAMTAKQLPNIPAPQITAVIAKEFDGKLVSYRELHSR